MIFLENDLEWYYVYYFSLRHVEQNKRVPLQKNGGGTEDSNPLMMNNLISSYNTIELKESLDSSLQQNIFKKDGFPNGYELSINHQQKKPYLLLDLSPRKLS